MTSAAKDIALPVETPESTGWSHSQRSIWPLWVLLAVNSLSLPGYLLVNIVEDTYSHWTANYLRIFFGHALETQIFLLAFWLSFGGVPRRWRGLSVFLVAMLLGFGVAMGLFSIAVLNREESLDPDFPLSAILVTIPIFVIAALWVMNAVYVIPAWFFGMEIRFPGSEAVLAIPPRTFGIVQLFTWTAQLALPLGLLNVMMVLDNGDVALTYWSLAPFAAILLCCTPLLIVLLTPRLSAAWLLLAFVWVGLIAGVIALLPPNWEASAHLASPPLLTNVVVVVANCIALRSMQLRWSPRAATGPLPHA